MFWWKNRPYYRIKRGEDNNFHVDIYDSNGEFIFESRPRGFRLKSDAVRNAKLLRKIVKGA